LTTKSKGKSKGGGWLDRLFPANPPIHYISPLPLKEVLGILNDLNSNKALISKIDKVETTTGSMYKFSIFQRYARSERHGKIITKGGLGDPTQLSGEQQTRQILSGVLQGAANDQTLFTFEPPPSNIIGCLLIAWGVFLFSC
jgi:hypothetical protein